MLLRPIFAWHMHQTTLLIGQCLRHLLNCCIPGSDPSHFRRTGKNNTTGDWDGVVFKYYRSPSTNKLFGAVSSTASFVRVLPIQRDRTTS